MNKIRLIGTLITGLFLAGCSQGVVIDDPARTATFILEKGYGKAKLLGGSTNMYFLETAGQCEGLQLIAEVGGFSGKETRRPVPAGGLAKIYGEVIIKTDAGYAAVWVNRCAQRASFTSEIGKTYRVRQLAALDQECAITVVDEATGETPADFRTGRAEICTAW